MPSLRRQFEGATFAFVGTVIAERDPKAGADVYSSADPIGFMFQVEMVWKGVAADTVTIWSPRSGASCGYRFLGGVRYLVLGDIRGGRMRSGLCSGSEPFERALVARYVLPVPGRIARGAVWPALDRADLLNFLRKGDPEKRDTAALLLASEFGSNEAIGVSLLRLLMVAPGESATILAAGTDSTRTAAALAQMAQRLLDSDQIETRAAAVEGLGWLARRGALVQALRRGFADRDEPVRAAAQMVLLARYGDLAEAEADELVARFITSIGTLSTRERWIGVHQLRFFVHQREIIAPFLKAVADTATDRQMKTTALDVMVSTRWDP